MADTTHKALNALSNTRFTTFWLDSLDAAADLPALDQNISCDLLIVGGDMVFAGGYSGFGAHIGLAILDKVSIPETAQD